MLGLSAAEAATFIGISATFFCRLVDDGTMPQPRIPGSKRLWSTIELSVAFSMLPREEPHPQANSDGQQPAINNPASWFLDRPCGPPRLSDVEGASALLSP